MNLKLLGSSGFAALAIFTLLGQHGTGSQAALVSQSETDYKPPSQTLKLASQIPAPDAALPPAASVVSAARPRQSPHPDAFIVDSVAELATRVKLLSSFASPAITGVLKPDGFVRQAWQTLASLSALNPAELPEDPFIVMLDPGHGGTDPGAEAHNGLLEKDLTLDIAKRAQLFLSELDNVEVVLTRHHDHGLSRQSRVNAIKKSEADMVISLHFNHLPQTELTLVESYYAGPKNIAESQASQQARANGAASLRAVKSAGNLDLGFTKGSERLAKTLQQRIFNEVSFENPNASNAGVKQETLFVLTRSFTPGVLMELTCLSNVQEADKLNTDDYRNRLAAALVDGIRSYRDSLEHSPLDTLTDIGV